MLIAKQSDMADLIGALPFDEGLGQEQMIFPDR